MSERINLANYSEKELEGFFVRLGEPKFRARQFIHWVHQMGVIDFAQMTNFKKALRDQLVENACIEFPVISHQQRSQDGTRKWVLQLADGQCIETVYIPEAARGTLCISSQVGCALNCQFCSTAQQGFNRDLTLGEIIGQVWIATRELSSDGTSREHVITNIVLMGMGEPLLNYDNVLASTELMLADYAYNLSKYRVTLSTSGIVPKMSQLAAASKISLAVSLHAPNDELRNQLVPINRKYPLEQLMAACREFFKDEPKRQVTMEYVMIDNVNDKPQHAQQLSKLLRGIPVKINLIPFNPFPGTELKRSSAAAIATFREILQQAGYNTIVRKTRGDDIDAACGQLVGKVIAKNFRKQKVSEAVIVDQRHLIKEAVADL